MAKLTIEKDLPSTVMGRDWLVGEPTKLLDRVEPLIQEILLPKYDTWPGKITASYDQAATVRSGPDGKRAGLIKRVFGQMKSELEECPSGYCCLDLRRNSPQNWAHAFTNHLPLALFFSAELKIPANQICVVLPANASRKIRELFELVEFFVVASDGAVKGSFCEYDVEPWVTIRGSRCDILRSALSSSTLKSQILDFERRKPKLFISRRDTRKLVNEHEVEAYLEKQGYEKIYPEDYDLLEQIALIVHASEIVAVHGAGLGPMVFKSLVDRPYKLLEIFSPAHVTNVWRLVAHQTHGSWVGVRGDVWPSLLSKNAKFLDNLQDFRVSMEALERAMEILVTGQSGMDGTAK